MGRYLPLGSHVTPYDVHRHSLMASSADYVSAERGRRTDTPADTTESPTASSGTAPATGTAGSGSPTGGLAGPVSCARRGSASSRALQKIPFDYQLPDLLYLQTLSIPEHRTFHLLTILSSSTSLTLSEITSELRFSGASSCSTTSMNPPSPEGTLSTWLSTETTCPSCSSRVRSHSATINF